MKTIDRAIVGTFLFSNDKHILLGKSRKGGVYNDVWIVPGGGIEPGETLQQAARRETFEEVGVDISGFTLQQLDGTTKGESTKILRDTGEKVLVPMTFYDFAVYGDKPAADIPFICDDDLVLARWHPIDSLSSLNITQSMRERLRQLNIN